MSQSPLAEALIRDDGMAYGSTVLTTALLTGLAGLSKLFTNQTLAHQIFVLKVMSLLF
jgi:hypothetical protein